MHFIFLTTNHIRSNAVLKRAFGMGNALAVLGHQVTIACADFPENREAAATMSAGDCHFFPDGLSRAEEVQWKEALIQKLQPDLVFINALGRRNAVRKRVFPQAYYVAEHCELESRHPNQRMLRRIYQYFQEWKSIWSYDCICCASVFLTAVYKERCLRFGLKTKVFRAPYAVEGFLDRGISSPLLVESDGIKRIFHVGTVNRVYGIEYMLKGLIELADMRQDWLAVFAGQGKHVDEMRELVAQHGLTEKIQFTGYIDESALHEQLAIADVFMSYVADTFQDWTRNPSKIYLYLPFGKPIVTSPIGDNYFLLGQQGVYFEPESPASIVEALSKAMDLQAEEMPSIDAKAHNWDARAKEFLSLLRVK